MKLARLSQRMREHDWMSAAIELVIVIAGILIALQVDNWNHDRIDRARAQDYYRRIHADLETDIRRIAVARAYYKVVSDYQTAALASGENGHLVNGSAWKTVLAWYQASQIMPFELEDISFTELRDTGAMGLIADEKLRERLASYYRFTGVGITADLLRHNPAYRVQIRSVTPSKVQEYIWAHCFRQLDGVNQYLLDCPSPMSDADAGALLTTYRANDSLLQNLRYWHTWLGVSDGVLGVIDDSARRLAKDVEAARNH